MGQWQAPADLRYAKSDEWFARDGDTVTIGITDYAQDQLNDIVYVEFRDEGERIAAGDSFGEVESVKAASELYSALAGEIIAVNSQLEDEPELVNADPYGAGWLVKLRVDDAAQLDALLDAAAYNAWCDSR